MIERLSLVKSPCTTSGQQTEQVHSYNPGARTGPGGGCWIGSFPAHGQKVFLSKLQTFSFNVN